MMEFEYPDFAPKVDDLPTALALLELEDWALVEGIAGMGVGLAMGTPVCDKGGLAVMLGRGEEFMLDRGEEDWAMISCWGCCME